MCLTLRQLENQRKEAAKYHRPYDVLDLDYKIKEHKEKCDTCLRQSIHAGSVLAYRGRG